MVLLKVNLSQGFVVCEWEIISVFMWAFCHFLFEFMQGMIAVAKLLIARNLCHLSVGVGGKRNRFVSGGGRLQHLILWRGFLCIFWLLQILEMHKRNNFLWGVFRPTAENFTIYKNCLVWLENFQRSSWKFVNLVLAI